MLINRFLFAVLYIYLIQSGTGTGVATASGGASVGLPFTGAGVVGAGVDAETGRGVSISFSSAFLSVTKAKRHGSQMVPLPDITWILEVSSLTAKRSPIEVLLRKLLLR